MYVCPGSGRNCKESTRILTFDCPRSAVDLVGRCRKSTHTSRYSPVVVFGEGSAKIQLVMMMIWCLTPFSTLCVLWNRDDGRVVTTRRFKYLPD